MIGRPDTDAGPAARVLSEATLRVAALGHENLGPLSESHGFVNVAPPLHHLPPPHDAWTTVADELPDLVRTLRLRQRLDELPLLDASPESLEDRYLLRAASVIGLLTQAYNNVPMRPPERLPDQLVRPWLQIAERLDRPAMTLCTMDYIWHNWYLVDPQAADPMRVENLRVLTPIWDHPQMENFMLVVLEMMARSAPLVGCAVRAQEACRRQDDAALGMELVAMAENIRSLTYDSLPKASPMERAGSHRTDPVVWTKLFAMLPLPVKGAEGVRNASGVETPTFHLMDVFLGRRTYDTQLGHEAVLFRHAYPPHWRDFLLAVAEEPVIEYVLARNDPTLNGLTHELTEAYQGKHGMLGRHRLKAFSYMDAAFKTGRSATVTGFSGMFEDRAWEKVDASFEAARVERQRSGNDVVRGRFARVEAVEQLVPDMRRIVLGVAGSGVHCEPGDRCAIMPENEPELVARTLQALRATGEEQVDLTAPWMAALPLRPGRARALGASLRDVLTFGHIRPVLRTTAKQLYALTSDQSLHAIVEARTEDQWELWDLLELLSSAGFAPQRLWRAERGDYENISRLVPPLAPRLYSVSSITAAGGVAEQIELTVGQLSYDSVASATSRARPRRGTASTYLCRTLDASAGTYVPIQIVHPAAFSLPAEASVPIVMFAGGSGIAPFKGFLEARAGLPGTQNLLFACARNSDALPYRAELERYAQAGQAEVRYGFSRDPSNPRRVDDLMREPEMAARLRALAHPGEDGGLSARLYVCGRATFARTVIDTLAEILDEPDRPGREAVFRLVAENRFMQDVFSTYTGSTAEADDRIDVSDLTRRTGGADGVWSAINGRVYDLTEFAAMHPGGHRIIHSHAGMDATGSYRVVEHHLDPQVEAMLAMYEIGVMRRLHFGSRWSITIGERGLEYAPLASVFARWVKFLYTVVEISNAHAMETSIRREPLNRSERYGELQLTPYRLQFGIESHARFMAQTLPTVCVRFADLWQATSGPCSPSVNVRRLATELDQALAGASADGARALGEELGRDLEHAGATAELDEQVAELQAADGRYLAAARRLLADGARVFEVHEGRSLVNGGEDLLETLSAFPRLTCAYLDEVSTRLPRIGALPEA